MIREDKTIGKIQAKVKEVHGDRKAPKPAIKNYSKLSPKVRERRIKKFLKRQGIEILKPKKP